MQPPCSSLLRVPDLPKALFLSTPNGSARVLCRQGYQLIRPHRSQCGLHGTSLVSTKRRGARKGRTVRCESSKPHWHGQGKRDVVLVADIGGTNCRFELWQTPEGGGQRLLEKTFRTKTYTTFQDALDALSHDPAFVSNPPSSAAFACAGPVMDNKCIMTNLSWTIDGHYLSQIYGIKFAVLNDFQANGYGIPALKSEDLITLNDMPARPQAPKVVIGPGTGLGEAQLMWDEALGTYRVWPGEGSHGDFGARGWKQRALAAYVESQIGYCETEHVACGSGLERIYEFLITDPIFHTTQGKVPPKDAPAITKAALDDSDPIAVEAVDLMMCIVGQEAARMGLACLATGGVYICGGIFPRLKTRMQKGTVLEAFLHSNSRFYHLLRTFPLYVVTNSNLGLLGARQYASFLLNNPGFAKELQLAPENRAEDHTAQMTQLSLEAEPAVAL